jgi:hypothetical protein
MPEIEIASLAEVFTLPAGAWGCYHEGSLQRPSGSFRWQNPDSRAGETPADHGGLARELGRLADDGRVTLTQRRLGEHHYRYLARAVRP